jgi:hypothetical protein
MPTASAPPLDSAYSAILVGGGELRCGSTPYWLRSRDGHAELLAELGSEVG